MKKSTEEVKKSKQASESVQESEEKFRIIFEGANDGILVADIKTKKFVLANPRICEMTGYSQEELAKLTVDNIHPKKDLSYVNDQFTKQVQGKIAVAKDIPVLRKDKTVVYCDVNSKLVKIGERECLVGFFRDITERKKVESTLNKNQALLRDMAQTAKIGGWEFYVDTLTQTWTEETFRILEVDYDGAAPKVPEGVNFIVPEYRPMAEKAIQRAIKFGEPYDQEWEVVTAKGNRKWVRAVAKVNRTGGKITSVSGSFQDITERKKAEGWISEMSQMGFPTNRANDTLSEARLLFSRGFYKGAESLANDVQSIKARTIQLDGLADQTEEKIFELESQGIDASQAKVLFVQGLDALSREDYDGSEYLFSQVQSKSEELQAEASIRRVSQSGSPEWLLAQARENWHIILVACLAAGAAGMEAGRIKRKKKRQRMMAGLEKEKASLEKAAAETQKKYFERGNMSKADYEIFSSSYRKKLADVKRRKAVLEGAVSRGKQGK